MLTREQIRTDVRCNCNRDQTLRQRRGSTEIALVNYRRCLDDDDEKSRAEAGFAVVEEEEFIDSRKEAGAAPSGRI